MPDTEAYIHPQSSEIERLICKLCLRELPLRNAVEALLLWVDRHIAYSRLNAPYDPLQRSDLDVLRMRSGTCGDYANLLVSVFTGLGYSAQYAVVHVDCYGDPQDHICAAVWNDAHWQLIDAALPYRKWHGLGCPHREYELLSYDDMKSRWKQEEAIWKKKAAEWGCDSYAGLLYAPWMHEDVVLRSENALETVFYLLMLNDVHSYTVYVWYLVYTESEASAAVLCTVTGKEVRYRFSVNCVENIWDEKQWGEPYPKENVPERYRSDGFSRMVESMDRVIPIIQRIVRR